MVYNILLSLVIKKSQWQWQWVSNFCLIVFFLMVEFNSWESMEKLALWLIQHKFDSLSGE